MSAASERAREACESCRRSHKRCTYDDSSTRCLRCEKRNTPCSLFLTVETTTAAQGPAMMATEPAPDSWDGIPHDSAAASSFPYQLLPPQGHYYFPNAIFTEHTQGYPADTILGFQSSATQHESAQPVTNQSGSYEHNNVFH